MAEEKAQLVKDKYEDLSLIPISHVTDGYADVQL